MRASPMRRVSPARVLPAARHPRRTRRLCPTTRPSAVSLDRPSRALAVSLVVLLMGARQTGKSTLVQSEPFLEDRLYLTRDASGYAGIRSNGRRRPPRERPRLTLEEVQREPDLLSRSSGRWSVKPFVAVQIPFARTGNEVAI